jgi:peptidoglycan/xylan/chitin deacetylase (PgdA/CDA1 family)
MVGGLAIGAKADIAKTKLAQPQAFKVYLTFDDGPAPNPDFSTGSSDIILNMLRDYNAVATFFLHGAILQEWHVPLLGRFIHENHAIGNHLWVQHTNTVIDNPPAIQLAYNWFMTEDRIRSLLKASDSAAYDTYMAQPKVFRRPGGSDDCAAFLTPKFIMEHSRIHMLKQFQNRLDWLTGVYDYSSWHIGSSSAVDEVLSSLGAVRQAVKASTLLPRLLESYASEGIIIQMHDTSYAAIGVLSELLEMLVKVDAQFLTLPRPLDRPNTTLAIARVELV